MVLQHSSCPTIHHLGDRLLLRLQTAARADAAGLALDLRRAVPCRVDMLVIVICFLHVDSGNQSAKVQNATRVGFRQRRASHQDAFSLYLNAILPFAICINRTTSSDNRQSSYFFSPGDCGGQESRLDGPPRPKERFNQSGCRWRINCASSHQLFGPFGALLSPRFAQSFMHTQQYQRALSLRSIKVHPYGSPVSLLLTVHLHSAYSYQYSSQANVRRPRS